MPMPVARAGEVEGRGATDRPAARSGTPTVAQGRDRTPSAEKAWPPAPRTAQDSRVPAMAGRKPGRLMFALTGLVTRLEPLWLWRFSATARDKLQRRQQGITPTGRQVPVTAVSMRFSAAAAPF